MNPGWGICREENDVVTEVKTVKKLVVSVVMCCRTCVEKVEETVSGMPGVAEYTTDRWNDLLTIVESPSGELDQKRLLRKLKCATHDRKVGILASESATVSTPTTVTYCIPYIFHGYNPPVPWPPSSAASSSDYPFITNPCYFQHLVGCDYCIRNPGAVCANCGRASALGAMFS